MNGLKLNLIIVLAVLLFVVAVPIIHAQSYVNYCQSQGPNQQQGVINLFADWYCNDINSQVIQIWSADLPIAMVAINIAILVAVVIFMFGVALRNDRLRTFGVGELYEAMASLIIVVLFLFLAAVLFGLLPSLVAGPVNPYNASLTYIASTINSSSTIVNRLFTIAAADRYYSTITVSIWTSPAQSESVSSVVALAIIYLFFWPAWTAITFCIEAMISLYVQYYMIVFFMYAAIPLFLVPGVIFRSLLPTRNLGGMLMAIAIGFYFIMPTLFSVAYYFTSSSISSQLSQASSQLNQYGSGSGAITNAISPSSPLVVTVQNIGQTFSTFWLSILFFPALIVAITYSFITQIAELIGGMAKPSSRLRHLV